MYFKDDYKEHKNIERPKPFIPQDNPQLRDEAFQGCTSYKFNYTGKQNPTPMQSKFNAPYQLTLPMLRLLLSKAQERKKIFETHLNPVKVVFIGKLSLSTLR